MKKTTYIMLGIILAGFVGAITFAIMCVSFTRPCKDIDLSGDTQVVRELPRFSALRCSVKTDTYYLTPFESVLIVESDSVTTPFVQLPEKVSNAYTFAMTGDTLTLSFDSDVITDDLTSGGRRGIRSVYINYEETDIRVNVPRGMMSGVSNRHGSLKLSGFQTDFVKTEAKDRVRLYDCRIDTLRCATASMDMLVAVNSEISLASLRQPRNHLKIITEGDTCMIRRIEVSGDRRKGSQINLTKANVGALDWKPTDPDAVLNLSLSSPKQLSMR